MTDSNTERGRSHISHKFGSARERFRQIRHNIHKSLHKAKKYDVEIIPSPFTDRPDLWSGLAHAELYLPPHNMSDSEAESLSPTSSPTTDGATDRMFRRGQKPQGQSNMSAIFVHAGAGYHSTTNEHIHLGACNEYADPFL